MPETRLGLVRVASIIGLSGLTLGIGLGGSGRLTYHEAFVAQAARELITQGAVLVPTIDGQPWLEKPPLAVWLVALAGKLAGGVTEFVARTPSAIAATLMALGLASFTARRFGRNVGWLAGLIQATTFWFVVRGRLAEADIVLACLITWTFVAFDRLRNEGSGSLVPSPHLAMAGSSRTLEPISCRAGLALPITRHRQGKPCPTGGPVLREPVERVSASPALRLDPASADLAFSPVWLWAFFAGLGATSLLKGLGFGAVLVGSAVATVLIWDRDRSTIRALMHPKAWMLAGLLALTWPALVLIRLPSAVSLWALHVTDRLASHPEHFIGGPWWQYGAAVLEQTLPWTPLALVGAWPSMLRAIRGQGRGGVDRLLWSWLVVPVLVLSAATVKNDHYAIYAFPPMATWAALGLVQLGGRLQRRRGWSPERLQRGAATLFVGLGLAWGLGHLGLGPRFDRRGGEWAWTESVGRELDPKLPLVLLYEDWDRKPYPTPFGPVPHDWAVRLYYLRRPALWRQGVDDLASRPPEPSTAPYALLARDRDVPALAKLGQVETLMHGPSDRFDREFRIFRLTPTALP